MSRSIQAGDLLALMQDVAALPNMQTYTQARAIRAIDQAVRWFFRPITQGGEGYGESEVTVTAMAGVETVDLNTLTPLKVQYRGLLRPTAGVDGYYLRATHIDRPNYADTVGAAYDEFRSQWALPGVYWYETALDGQSDLLYLRPVPTVAEEIKIIGIGYPPTITQTTDTVLVEYAWEQPIVYWATSWLLRANDLALSADFRAEAERSRQELIDSWQTERDSAAPDSVYKYMRRSQSARWRYPWWI